MYVLFILILLLTLVVVLFLRLPQFGKRPSGHRLERIHQSPNYRNGQFQNQSPTPMLNEGHTMTGQLNKFLFQRHPRTRPQEVLPTVKTDLKVLPSNEDLMVWFGHSSYLLQLRGYCLLVDPVFSGNAAPIRGTNKAFPGTDLYTVEDLPEIDLLLITHDHYDHLDYRTVKALRSKVRQVICGLGVGEHLEHWGYDAAMIVEKDWNESVRISDDFEIHTAPARHFSGRKLARNTTLWLSFVIKSVERRIYLGGDSGYDTHFAELGRKYGPFDLAILENGQYNEAWSLIHMLPEDVVAAAKDLNARYILPVHSAKFKLSIHPWDEPLERLTALSRDHQLSLLTPLIGEPLFFDQLHSEQKAWWKGLR